MENPAETIYSRYGPSVVAIWASGGKTQGSIGAGSLISQDGLVVTKEKDARKYRFETHKRPYDYNDLTKVEEELEDMMKEMRGKIR